MAAWEAWRQRSGESVLTLDDVWAQRRSPAPEGPRVERLRAVDLKLRRGELTALCHTSSRLLGDVILGDHPRRRGRIYHRNENLECTGAGHRRPEGVIGLHGRPTIPPGVGTAAESLEDLLVAVGSTPREAKRLVISARDRLSVAGLTDYLHAPHNALGTEELWALDVLRVMLLDPDLVVVSDPWPNACDTTPRRVWADALAAATRGGTSVLLLTRHGMPERVSRLPGDTYRIKLTGDLLPQGVRVAS